MGTLDASLPIQPLLDYWTRSHPAHLPMACRCTTGGRCGSYESLADALTTSRSTLFRRIQERTVTMDQADKWAARLGVHATSIWHNWAQVPITAAMQTPRGPLY